MEQKLTIVEIWPLSSFNKDAIKKSFKPFDGPGDTLEEIKNLRTANNGNINEHIAKFKKLIWISCISGSHGFIQGNTHYLPPETGDDL